LSLPHDFHCRNMLRSETTDTCMPVSKGPTSGKPSSRSFLPCHRSVDSQLIKAPETQDTCAVSSPKPVPIPKPQERVNPYFQYRCYRHISRSTYIVFRAPKGSSFPRYKQVRTVPELQKTINDPFLNFLGQAVTSPPPSSAICPYPHTKHASTQACASLRLAV
jgi:hypothetical protein